MTPEQKQARIVRAEHHAAQDRLIAGTYIQFPTQPRERLPQACSVGCDLIDILGLEKALQRLDGLESIYEPIVRHDGTAAWVEEIRDAVFEELSEYHADDGDCDQTLANWHIDIAKAMPVNTDWNAVRLKMCVDLGIEPEFEIVDGLADLLADWHDRDDEERSPDVVARDILQTLRTFPQ